MSAEAKRSPIIEIVLTKGSEAQIVRTETGDDRGLAYIRGLNTNCAFAWITPENVATKMAFWNAEILVARILARCTCAVVIIGKITLEIP